MKIVILDGSTDSADRSWVEYLAGLKAVLSRNGHQVTHFILKDMNIRHCTGCFGCWVKTPGLCVIKDDMDEVNRQAIQADFVLWASPLVLGFPSYYLKRTMDRSIPLVHPYITMVNGEAHHLARYERYPVFGLLVQPDANDDQAQIDLVGRISARTALNIKSKLAFSETTGLPVAELADKIVSNRDLVIQPGPDARPQGALARISPPKRLLVINGSPRGSRGNTPILLQKFIDGFLSVEGTSAEMLHLTLNKDKSKLVESLRQADAVLLGFPLYTDGMPGIVKEFIDALTSLEGGASNPPLAFLVQSGFPEAAHSRYVERYLQSLAERLRSPYLGALVRGGCEGVRLMPDKMNRSLFEQLGRLGGGLARDGAFNPSDLRALASVERYPGLLIPILKLVLKLPVAQMYWDSQLKKNDVYERRFDRPYA